MGIEATPVKIHKRFTSAKMSKMDPTKKHEGSFGEGYIDGWKSVKGPGAALPGIPAHAIPAGKTPYEHGYDEGRAAAER